MAIIGLIPARGNSKGIKRKNISLCAGKPLISYTCEAANESQYIDRVIVSTDSDEIAGIALQCKVEVPFKRPSNISDDETPMISVLRHAAEYLIKQESKIDAIVLLQPTSPLRNAKHIDEALKLYFDNKPESVVSVTEVPHQFIPESLYKMGSFNKLVHCHDKSEKPATRRQDKPKLYARNGPAIVIMNIDVVKRGEIYGKNTVGYIMEKEYSVDVDSLYDLKLAEFMLINGHKIL